MSVQHVSLAWNGRPVEIEIAWILPELSTAPVMVFLHEGLGSVAMWKDFPQRLCQALGWRGLVYSRPGYGRSTPRPVSETWGPDFMHRQARELLPALLQALGLSGPEAPPLWLFGHSDGGSITLLHASGASPSLSGAIVLAPHILVEDISVRSIEVARQAYESGPLRAGLARYHDDPDSAFWGWNRIWLDPAFRDWNITAELAHIHCPVLAVQGLDDEYGTLEQIRGIARQAPQTQLLELPGCGHSPHRDQPEALIAAVQAFVKQQPLRPA
ncbi:alpha/beta fold hydrolase [Curvibacter lanceolatus]|uniref:alpha/beta fold hydrolase n=1 Tax=Curvibacter lanceolatus TaxID=86182 RepID=UPI00036F65EF|nr:alpha/beta hydrolase [Curvibacter lanceolatus]